MKGAERGRPLSLRLIFFQSIIGAFLDALVVFWLFAHSIYRVHLEEIHHKLFPKRASIPQRRDSGDLAGIAMSYPLA